MLNIFVFNIGAGQAIFFYPKDHPEYGMFVDCAESEEMRPIDVLIGAGLLPKSQVHGDKHHLGNLTITNYDHDHFCGLPKILEKVHVDTITFPKNMTSDELRKHKEEITEALEHVCRLKDEYTAPAPHHQPPYGKEVFHLNQSDLDGEELNTNHLSQIVFIKYGGSQICIPGDLERPAWEKILQMEGVRENLKATTVFVASHHGRENGYHESVFEFCKPECIIISDKPIVHETQVDMASTYARHVDGAGVLFGDRRRQVLSTRNDGHIHMVFSPNGDREYSPLE